MLVAERREAIHRTVRSGVTAISELASCFGVSEMTVRRDLQALESEGLVERVRGGAIAPEGERPFNQTLIERLAVKSRIGAAAAALVSDQQTLMIDVGTTTLQLAHHLRDRELTVVTTNLAVYEQLLGSPQITIVLPGGEVRRNYRSLVGFIAEQGLAHISADMLFLGASGIDRRLRVCDSTQVEVPIKRTMIRAASRIVLLVDGAKFGNSGFEVCRATEVDTIITDPSAPAAEIERLRSAGIEVILA
jgi:DeoR/GlpR family transcriptional regulator of sugar metabolism